RVHRGLDDGLPGSLRGLVEQPELDLGLGSEVREQAALRQAGLRRKNAKGHAGKSAAGEKAESFRDDPVPGLVHGASELRVRSCGPGSGTDRASDTSQNSTTGRAIIDRGDPVHDHWATSDALEA